MRVRRRQRERSSSRSKRCVDVAIWKEAHDFERGIGITSPAIPLPNDDELPVRLEEHRRCLIASPCEVRHDHAVHAEGGINHATRSEASRDDVRSGGAREHDSPESIRRRRERSRLVSGDVSTGITEAVIEGSIGVQADGGCSASGAATAPCDHNPARRASSGNATNIPDGYLHQVDGQNFLGPVPARQKSWGQIKTLYR